MPNGSFQVVYYVGTGTLPTNLGQQTIRLGQGAAAGLESSAETGESSTSSLEVDDPAAAWDFVGLHSVYGVENAAPTGSHRLWTGIAGKRTIRRGQTGPTDSLRTDVARRWSIDLIDHNELQGRRVITGSDGDRPAETIAARLTWLLASSYVFAGLDQGHVQYPTDALDKNDYRGQTPAQVLDNMSTVCGYDWFTKHNESSGDPELFFFAEDDGTFYVSGTTFSNVLADIRSVSDGSILAPEPSSYLEIDPGRVFSGVYLTYSPTDGSSGSVYRTRAATATAFGGWRDTTVTRSDVHTATMANRVGDQYLARCATESQRVYWDAWTPAANVNDVYEGMLTYVKETHWGNVDAAVGGPDWTGYVPVRVLRRNVMANQATDEFYMVHYEGVPVTLASGFHQVVLTAQGTGTGVLHSIGSARAVWGGTSLSVNLQTSGIAQDTDGFAVQIPDVNASNDGPLPFVSCQQVIVPAGCGGEYRAQWGQLLVTGSYPWFSSTSLLGHPVAFANTLSATGFIDCVSGGTVFWAGRLMVNGYIAIEDMHTQTLPPGPTGLIAGTSANSTVRLSEGDLVEFWCYFSGPNLFGFSNNALGSEPFGGQQGVLALTWLRP